MIFLIWFILTLSTTEPDILAGGTDPVVREIVAKATAVGVSNLKVAHIADHHEMEVALTVAHIALVLAIVNLYEHCIILVYCLIASEDFKLRLLFKFGIPVGDGVKPLLAKGASIGAVGPPVFDTVKAE